MLTRTMRKVRCSGHIAAFEEVQAPLPLAASFWIELRFQ